MNRPDTTIKTEAQHFHVDIRGMAKTLTTIEREHPDDPALPALRIRLHILTEALLREVFGVDPDPIALLDETAPTTEKDT